MNSALLPLPPLVGAFDWPLFPSSQLRACGKRLKNSSKHRRGRPAFTPAPAAASPGPASPVVLLRSRLSNRSSRSPGSDVFFYSGHPTIFPASFISSMDSLQSFISSFTQLLWEFAFNSATSAFPLLAVPMSSLLSLRVRCSTPFFFLNCFLIHMPFKHAVSQRRRELRHSLNSPIGGHVVHVALNSSKHLSGVSQVERLQARQNAKSDFW
ncbi:hypothetical protein ILYODFUR_037822 [Ilyodon furcidens]|uniref:Uncharacterized protein n=1 Tax=Ilyodon furcidens TaxID=33524 RepID=A0ABV0U2Y5_9TELE